MKKSLLAVAGCTLLLGSAVDTLPAPVPTEPMEHLSRQFARMEKSLAASDAPGVHAAAEAMRANFADVAKMQPQRNAKARDGFASRVERLADLAREVDHLARTARFPGAAQAFAELRGTCVSCHVHFRKDNETRGLYPAEGNTLAGRIRLSGPDGEQLDDRSWVLVFLESESAGRPENLRDDPGLSQEGRSFHPRVLPVLAGTTVGFPNDDTIFHNVFSLSKTAPFDLGVYPPGESRELLMKRPGLVKVYCNIHPEMAASIVVLANPWFTLTDASGLYALSGVPDGDYVLRGWTDKGGDFRKEIRVTGEALVVVDFEIKETLQTSAHLNKYGKRYPGKYE